MKKAKKVSMPIVGQIPITLPEEGDPLPFDIYKGRLMRMRYDDRGWLRIEMHSEASGWEEFSLAGAEAIASLISIPHRLPCQVNVRAYALKETE